MRLAAVDRVVGEEHDVSLADRHVDDDRPLRDVGAAVEQARDEQRVLRVEPQRARAAGTAAESAFAGLRFSCSSVGSAYCHGCTGCGGGSGGRFVPLDGRAALDDVGIVRRAASGRPSAAGSAAAPAAGRRAAAAPPPPRPPPPTFALTREASRRSSLYIARLSGTPYTIGLVVVHELRAQQRSDHARARAGRGSTLTP